MNRLFMDEIVSVGFVKEGDNPDADVVAIYKASPQGDETKSPNRADNEEGANVTFDLSALSDEVRKAVEDHISSEVERIVAERQAPEPVEAEVLKDAPDEVRELVAKQNERIAELGELVEASQREKRTADFVAKAGALEGLLGKPDEVGPVLMDLADNAPDAFAALEGMLTAASQRQSLGEVFKEYGTESADDPQARVDAFVSKARSEGDKRNVSEIRAEFYAANPEVVRQLREVN